MTATIQSQRIVILDFGSQYTQLIARRVREAGVYSEILPWDVDAAVLKGLEINGFILSGGPETVTGDEAPVAPQFVFDSGLPVLGICYGMQTMAAQLGGTVASSTKREFGYASLHMDTHSELTDGIVGEQLDVWMSHGDKVTELPSGFEILASTESAPIAAMVDQTRHYYGLQFHPEVTHTHKGDELIRRFVREVCRCDGLWNISNIAEKAIADAKETIGNDHVILGLSGGVDSSVVAAL
jgi:GMP synthase (glutamine-hydrolysing)